ncbi:MAG: M1 family aminopeptidase [Marmoricola sp.]
MRRIVVALVSLLLLAGSAAAAVSATNTPPGPGAPGIGDPYFPKDGNGGYDVRHYRIHVTYDPATNGLVGRVEIRARSLQALSRLNLDLVGLKVDAVRVDDASAAWSRTAHELKVTPKHAIAKGHRFSVVVRYHGVPKVLNEPALGESGVFPTADGALVVGQPHVAATWFPVNDHPSDKATYSVSITVPKGLEALSNGYLSSKRTRGATTTWNWRMTKPMASYLATATTGQFNLKTYKRDGLSFIDAIDPVLFRKPLPRTGGQYVLSGGDDNGYKRLIRTIAVPAGGGRLTFHVTRNTERTWDFFAVEANPVGTNDWTTLPDLNGHSSQDTGNSCFSWQQIHPFLAHYQGFDAQDNCTPTGTTGSWNAVSGASDGYETWSVDLSAYAGKRVQLALSVISDETVSNPGAWVDDIAGPGGQGTTSFEPDGNTMDGWVASAPPAGSPANVSTWRVASSDPRPSTGANARAALDREPAALRFLATILGPYPFKQAGGIVDDDPSIGFALENQTRPIYSKDFFTVAGEENDSVITHELAHQWIGDNLALYRWRDIWLNEGFATYMEWLWSEDQGRDSADDIFGFYTGIPADDPFWQLTIGDPGPANLFDGAVYGRGAMTLHALRGKIGDDDFFRLLKRWTAIHSGGNVTTPQFIALAERISGQELGPFFKSWLYTASKPAGLPTARLQKGAAHAGLLQEKDLVRHLRR